MEQVVARDNLVRALKRIEEKKDKAPGVDGMRVSELRPYLRANWPEIRAQLYAGEYEPQPVRRTEIPKDGGGKRQLGIPTVLDRFLQQALLQVLNPIFDPTFSDNSYGFRPGRNRRQAVEKAQPYIQAGKSWTVDMDLNYCPASCWMN